MKYMQFNIKNFKGIKKIDLKLNKTPSGKIFPLVGLNESGKTTVLEAVNLFQNDLPKEKRYELIHKKDRGHFTGSIEIEAVLTPEEKDNELIIKFLREKSLELEKNIEKIKIVKKYGFKKAEPEDLIITELSFEPILRVKTSRARTFRDASEEIKNEIKKKLISVLPKILYFPDFLFDFPEKIYLESVSNPSWDKKEQERQTEYRNIIQDILFTINKDYGLNDFLGKLKALSDEGKQESASQIRREIATKLNEIIVAPWQEIFPNSPEKTIEIITNNDSHGYFLQIKINEGASSFYINERSLGFKWFFGFLLSTEFRKARPDENGEYIFLFDEPANNLHQNSQQKLLNLFEKLTDNAKIIYATHSHYLLSPKFILNAFIIKDEGRSNENEYEYRQDITATRYAQFVANYPKEESHFKPILDVLEYIKNPFELMDNVIFFEGKFDYYTFKWIKKLFFDNENYEFHLYPGAGVDRYENIFREYLAHNIKFIAIFDSNRAGKEAQKNYLDKISQELENNIFTLNDIDDDFTNFTTESLFSDEEKLSIQKSCPDFQSDTRYNKKHFNSAIQELFIKEESFELFDETKRRFKKIFNFIVTKLGDLD